VICSRKTVDERPRSVVQLDDSGMVPEIRAATRHQGVHVEMTRLLTGTPQGNSGTGAPACMYWESVESGAGVRGFVQDHQAITTKDDAARPMGTPGGRSG
jgi:hypothetical protein